MDTANNYSTCYEIIKDLLFNDENEDEAILAYLNMKNSTHPLNLAQHGGSIAGRAPSINRNFSQGHANIMRDYFEAGVFNYLLQLHWWPTTNCWHWKWVPTNYWHWKWVPTNYWSIIKKIGYIRFVFHH